MVEETVDWTGGLMAVQLVLMMADMLVEYLVYMMEYLMAEEMVLTMVDSWVYIQALM